MSSLMVFVLCMRSEGGRMGTWGSDGVFGNIEIYANVGEFEGNGAC